jgi:hypothetical protein
MAALLGVRLDESGYIRHVSAAGRAGLFAYF